MPEHLDAGEQKRLATRTIPVLLLAGYKVNCTPEVFDESAYRQAVHDLRTRAGRPAVRQQAPIGSPSPATPARRTP
ncbi:hypothetical protein ACF1G5_24700 [Streptomyces coeruleorubidus]|uniref:hypothetical protein n=1 Tax=Streptomyces coeruleorubidus TaxID=116188 RepID=UPI0036FA9A06